MADMTIAARAMKLRHDVQRVLSGSSAIFLPAEVKTLLQEQADILSALAQLVQNQQGEDF
jgi:hypothetical protein